MCGKMNTVKEIRKAADSDQTTKRLFTQPLKSDCTNYSNISIFTFQVFFTQKFPNYVHLDNVHIFKAY